MLPGVGDFYKTGYNGYPLDIDPSQMQGFNIETYPDPLTDELHTRPLHFENRPRQLHYDDDDMSIRKYVYTGVAAVSLIAENLLSHPFVVLRRQCQVHNKSRSYHLVPITLIPVIYNLHQNQGLTALWKGLGSVLLVRGLSVGIEDLISKITPWPKEISLHSSTKQFLQHTLLKCISFGFITPFYSASLVETVQSDIASEKPGMFDVFKEGFMRLLNWGGGPTGRMLPVWALVLPTVTLNICRYFFSAIVQGSTTRLIHVYQKRKEEHLGALSRDPSNTLLIREIELTSSLIAIISSDILFYPFETILHRLHLQGTRTIIDNLDGGSAVVAIMTNYRGPLHCYESILTEEGVFGLYKGFGALILQYAAHIAVVHLTHFCLTEISTRLRGSATRKPANHSPPIIPNMATPGNAYLLP